VLSSEKMRMQILDQLLNELERCPIGHPDHRGLVVAIKIVRLLGEGA